MQITWIRFLLPPKNSIYELGQRARLLHFMLLVVFVGGLLIGLSNYLHGWMAETLLLSLLALICLVGLYLNRKGYYRIAAWIFCISVYAVLGLMMYKGAGLYDETVLAYPVFIICAAFLFGPRGLFTATLLSILAVFTMYALHVSGLFESPYHPSLLRAAIISILYALMALITGVVRTAWQTNLSLLHESYDLTLQGWAQALEYRDGETAGHSQRVTQLSISVGHALGLSAEEIVDLRNGSYLHDIGKMAISDHILLKPGPLTSEEWEVMKRHPIRSREFLSRIPFLQGAIPIVYSHHERWDGTGYPDGLKGKSIPLLARIFTVVDNWDALTSDRPYRKAWPAQEVVTYLKENAGKIFDPQIVEVFLSVVSTRG